jgi:hypothetical protein
MAVPWQTDTASCRSGYTSHYDPYLPTFWPARVPNQVLTEADYEIVMDQHRPLGERLVAFARRADWDRPLDLDRTYTDQINKMIGSFGDLGVVESRAGPGDASFPSLMQVENVPQPVREQLAVRFSAAGRRTDLSDIAKVHRFPHGLRNT